MTQALPPGSDPDEPIGPYRRVRKIGEGAMGSIYLAVDSRDGTKVALKTPNLNARSDDSLVRRFRREARAATDIRHPHVCRLFDANTESLPMYYAMEWIDGVTMRQWLDERHDVGLADAVQLTIKLASGLQAAHELGILHRDIKPDNVMMRGNDDPVIVDFGLARWFDRVGQSLLTVDGSIVGSPAYMSPEQIVCAGDDIGPASDVYSLGVLLFELLTGRLPFEGDGIAVLFKAAQEPAPPASELRKEIDSTLDAILQKALAKDPRVRFSTMLDFVETLDRYARGESVAMTELAVDIPKEPVNDPQPPDFVARRGWWERLRDAWR